MKKILIIGANSKIAKRFIEKYKKNYNLITLTKKDLDLSDEKNIDNFILNFNIEFDGVVFFSSLYRKDEKKMFLDEEQIKVNSISQINLILKLYNKIKENSKIIFLIDGGTIQPKKDFFSYTLSKDLLRSSLKNLALNYNKLIFLGIDLGPVETEKIGIEKEKFFSRASIKIKDPGLGLINLINFLLNEENFYSSGSVIDFTGGTYLQRKG